MLNDLYRQSWPRFLFAVVTGLLSGLAGAGVVSVISDCASSTAPVRTLAPLFFLVCIVQVLCKSFSQLTLMRLTQEAVYRLRIELCRKVLAMPYRKLEDMGKARLLAILTTDISTYTQAAQLMPSIFSNGIVIVVCLCYVALMSWKIFCCLALLLALGTSGYSFASRWPTRQMHKAREQIDVLFRLFRSLLEGIRELQLNASRAGHFIDQLVDPSAKHFRSLYVRAMVGYTFFDNLGGALFFLVIGLLLFVMPIWLPQPPNVMITLTFLLLYLISPVGEVMAALPSVRQSEIALGRIRQLEAELTVGHGEPVGPPFVDPFSHPVSGAPLLRFEAVYHNFPGLTEDKPFVLGPIDLSVEKGELLFIVGGNGSGKTTLAMLLLGLYAPEQGRIVLNGVGVDRLNLGHYRQYFSAVFSDFHLFDEILCGDQREIATKATNYLEKLGLAHKVRIESSRFSTTSLSLGQRKRMALVSSYLEDRPIYLFDEWAADQDPAFKRVFYTELLPELKRAGKTVFVISHDDTYFHCADRIVRLAEGKLIINRAPSGGSDVGIIQSASLA
ncbi:MAG TPA: cyclic peptide export ABC transporter [Acidobacteriaceae bacterium]